MNQLTVKAVMHKDVKGKVLYYLEITDGETLFHVNVGQKTYDTVYNMESQLRIEYQIDSANEQLRSELHETTLATAPSMQKLLKNAQKESK